MILLQVEEIAKSFGDKTLFENVSFTIQSGQKIGLVGRNGAGKTTLLRIIHQEESPDEGHITFKSQINIGFLKQNPEMNPQETVFHHVYHSSEKILSAITQYHQAAQSSHQGELQKATDLMDALHAWDFETKAKEILSRLNIHDFDKPIGELSGGQQKRVALAAVLINEPELLILDEPTNHLDMEMTEWLEEYMAQSALAILMVTHDRYFLNEVCSIIYEIDDQKLIQYEGNYVTFLEKREERLLLENAEIDKARTLMRKEIEWIRRMPKARTHKSKSRVDAFYEIQEVASQRKHKEQMSIDVQSERLGKKIMKLHKISKSYGDLVLLNEFNYLFQKGEKIGIIGKNGSGKTTLLDIICGLTEMDAGRVEMGKTVQLGYHRQAGLEIKGRMQILTAVKEIAEIITLQNGRQVSAAAMLNMFQFPYKMHGHYIHTLSGGEKKRLALLMVLMGNPNFLVLDEPTNDMDVPTLNILEDFLVNFQGCVIIVSHDRFFMDKVIDHLFVFEGNGLIKDFPGNYTQFRHYAKEKKKQEARTTAQDNTHAPKENKIKKFSFKHQHELKQLLGEIETLETTKTDLEVRICSGELAGDQLLETSRQLEANNKRLNEKHDRWLELEILRES